MASTGTPDRSWPRVTVRVREVRVRVLGERLRFGLPKIPTAGGQMSVRPPLQAVSGCGCEALRRTRLRSCALAAPTKADATFERCRRLPPDDLGRPPIREVKLVDDRAQARRRQDIVDHDHVARPQCRQLCKFRDRRHKAPRRSRVCPSTDSGTITEMDARSEPGLNDPFDEAIDDALSSLPADLCAAMSNIEIVVEDEPPDGQPLLGLY